MTVRNALSTITYGEQTAVLLIGYDDKIVRQRVAGTQPATVGLTIRGRFPAMGPPSLILFWWAVDSFRPTRSGGPSDDLACVEAYWRGSAA